MPRRFGALPASCNFRLRLAALENHPIELLAARDFDLQALGQGVRDRHADAVQAARSPIDLGVEFAARMQRAHDDFERGFFRKFGMRVDRDAAAVVGDGDETVGLHLDIDPVGVAGQRLVHGIVDDFGEQVMERLLVGAADIHTWPAPDRLEPFQNLDMFCRIAGLGRRAAGSRGPRPPSTAAARLTRAAEQIGGVLCGGFFCCFCQGLPQNPMPVSEPMWRFDCPRATAPNQAPTIGFTTPFRGRPERRI